MFNNFAQEQYIRNLQNIKNETEQKLQQALMMQQNSAVPPSINQTFQITPNNQNTNDFDGKVAKSVDDVKNTLALKQTIFINDNRDTLWIKDTSGAIKTYSLQEVVELDAKDIEINNLKKEIEELKEAVKYEQRNIKNVDDTVTKQKSARFPTNQSNNV